MKKEISTYYKHNYEGKFAKKPDEGRRAVVKFDTESAESYIDYYDTKGNVFYTEYFEGKSVHYVEDAAENWALGYKKLDGKITQGSLL